MTEFERQVAKNRDRADVQNLNKELQKADEAPLLFHGVPIVWDNPDVQILNAPKDRPNERREQTST